MHYHHHHHHHHHLRKIAGSVSSTDREKTALCTTTNNTAGYRTVPISDTAVSPRALATAHNSSTSWHNHQTSPPAAESSSPRAWAPTPSQPPSVLVPVPLPPHKAAYRLSRSDVVLLDGSGPELIELRRLLACLCLPPALLSVLA
ncbi:hypothetical protein CKAH01_09321 [Colletotrichum kahawae]|uniref:Uncharacterized protein n=1 Tax=Colletotrichum kahawae TaxID=34407 RepID=A0AAD9XYZ2_COLKA|nr:hypothetical protein CKAH01_09321 [Colletotrichum kahawae]